MVSWSTRHQFFYIAGAVAFLLFAIALPVFFVTYQAPSCSDSKQNQGELGIDCGGPCSLLCKAAALDLIVHWQRAFKVKDGVYNAVAYVENPNLDSGADSVPYVFKLYDKDNILIYERHGKTFVPPRKIFAVFESNLLTGNREAARTFFEFSQVPVWTRQVAFEPSFSFANESFSSDGQLPRLSAVISNQGARAADNVEVVAIVYDASDNAVASSRTVVDRVGKGGSAPLVFTWPEPFSTTATRIELLYRLIH